MSQFLVSVPCALHVMVDAPSADEITEDMVEEALLDQHGKYAEVDVRQAGTDNFEVLD